MIGNDFRISEWVNLVDLDPAGTVVVIGDPPPGTIEGVARYFEKIVLVPAGNQKNVGNKIIETRVWLGEGKLPLRDKEAAVVAVFPGFSVTPSLYSEIVRSVRSDGDVVLFPDRKSRKGIMKLWRHRACREYAVIPNPREPRWFVPLGKRAVLAASLKLYQPSLWGAKAKKIVFQSAARLGLAGFLPLNTFCHFSLGADKSLSRISDLAGRVWKQDEVHLALFTGTPPVGRKVTAQVMDTMGKVLGYVRISPDRHVYRLFENEKDCLENINSRRMKNFMVPSVLQFGKVGKAVALFQGVPPGRLSQGPARLAKIHLHSLAELYKLSSRQIKISDSHSLKEIDSRLQQLSGRVEKETHDLLVKGLGWIQDTLGGSPLRLGLAHGDFTPWNTRTCRGRLYIFDWEWARRDAPPFQDLYHFEISRRVFVNHEAPERIWRALQGRQFRKFLQDYRGRASVPEEMEAVALAWTLVDDISFYLHRFIDEGIPVPEEHELLNVCMGLLGKVMGERK